MTSTGHPPAHQGAGASQQLLEGERLAQVIVGAAVQPAHPVADRVARGDEEHGRISALAAIAVQDRQAVPARQPPVEDEQVPLLGPDRLQSRVAVGGVRDVEALVRQPVHDRSGEACVVLDHENPARHGNPSDPAISHDAPSIIIVFHHKRSGRRSHEGDREADFKS